LPSASSIETYFSMSFTLLHAPPAGRAGMTASLMAVIALAVFPSVSGECEPAWLLEKASFMLKVVSFIANAFRVMQESRPNSGRPVATHFAMFELWFEEIRERLRVGHSNSGDIVPTGCSLQMSIRAECDELNGALVQGYIPKRVVEHRRGVERLS
jgi:hypothetical protein